MVNAPTRTSYSMVKEFLQYFSASVAPPLGGRTAEIRGEENQRECSNPCSEGKQANKLALKLAVCRRACEPCGLSIFVSPTLLARAGVPGAGGISVECLVDFETGS